MRRKFVHMYYDKNWDAEAQFDLVLDTGAITLEAAIQQIIAAVQTLAARKIGSAETTTAKFAVDPVLANAVAKVLAYPLPAL